MSEETFRGVWHSLNEIGDFKTGTVKDPQQPLDPKTHHVVGIAYSLGGQTGTRTHMVPARGASPAFQEWLSSTSGTPANETAQPQHSADASQPFMSVAVRASSAAGSHR